MSTLGRGMSLPENYSHDGYAVFRGRAEVSEVADLEQQCVQVYQGPLQRHDLRMASHAEIDPGADRERSGLMDCHLWRLQELLPFTTALRKLLFSDAIFEALQSIDGETRYTLHQSIFFFASPRIRPHLDNNTLDTSPPGHSFTVWIAVDDVWPANGPPYVVPNPRGDYRVDTDLPRDEQEALIEQWLRETAPTTVALTMKAGDFAVWAPSTPHGSMAPWPGFTRRRSIQAIYRPTRYVNWGNRGFRLGADHDLEHEEEPVNERFNCYIGKCEEIAQRFAQARISPPANAIPAQRPSSASAQTEHHVVADVQAVAKPPRIPEAMIDLRFSRLRRNFLGSPSAMAREAKEIAERDGPRAANQYLLNRIGVHCTGDHSESYFAEALHYHLGRLQAFVPNPEAMAKHLALSRTMPSREQNRLYSDHINTSLVIEAWQQQAIARRVPPIFIASMPRSASATLTQTLSHALNAPIMELSIGDFPERFLAPSWLDMFLMGGAITHDHFAANEFNLGVLRGRPLRHVFVSVRDPRAAARSQVHHNTRNDGADGDENLGRRIELECLERFIPWLQGWLECAANADLPFRIHWLRYQDICADWVGTIRRIGQILANDYPAMENLATSKHVEERRGNFVTGDPDAWRSEVSDVTRGRLWAACSPEMKSLLDLKP